MLPIICYYLLYIYSKLNTVVGMINEEPDLVVIFPVPVANIFVAGVGFFLFIPFHAKVICF